MKEKRLRIVGLVIGCVVSILVGFTYILGFWHSIEDKALDLRFIVRGTRPASEDVVIVGIDEASIEKYGRFPWPRSHHARLVDELTQAGAKAVVFDIILSEHDETHPTGDSELGMSTALAGNVIHCSFFEPRRVISAVKGLETIVVHHEPIPEFRDASWDVGYANAYPDADGGLRNCALQILHQGATYYPINLLAAARYMGKGPGEIVASIPDRATYTVIDLDTAFDRTMCMVNYYGPEDSFSSYSYHQLVDENIPLVFKQAWVKDKVVLIGSKVVGAFDHYPLAFEKVYPGVEFHATVINNIIDGSFIKRYPPWLILIFVIIGGIFCGIAIPRFSPLLGTTAVAGLTVLYVAGTQWLFTKHLLYIQMVPPLVTLLVSYVAILFYRFINEEKEKRRIKRSFGQYVSRSVLDEILSNPNLAKLGGERRDMSILFSDIRSFTTISEGMTPEEVVDLLNEYLTKMTDVVYKHGGTLDKFIGDAVMAFWGAPIAMPDHAEKAVLCAVDMMDELKQLQEKWKEEGRTVMDIGVGVNSGEAVVGNMGSSERMDYTVIGDNVNLASRMEGLNKAYKSHIIIAESTHAALTDSVDVLALGGVKVKGKDQAINIYQVLGKKDAGAAAWRDTPSDAADAGGTRVFKTK